MKVSTMKNKSGFTLMEVIIVIAILAILAAIAVPTVSGYIEKSKESNDLQVATNIIRNIQTSIVNPANDVPRGCYFAVFWSTDSHSEKLSIHDQLIITVPANTRTSTISQTNPPPAATAAQLEKIAKSIFEMFGINESDITRYDNNGDIDGWMAPLSPAKSEVALDAKLYFHVDTSTGEVALAKYNGSGVGNPNLWLDLGVNATPAP